MRRLFALTLILLLALPVPSWAWMGGGGGGFASNAPVFTGGISLTGDLTITTGDIFLSTGRKIDFGGGDITLTHATTNNGILTLAGGQLVLPGGSDSLPSLRLQTDQTGLYSAGTGSLSVVLAGARYFTFATGQFNAFVADLVLGAAQDVTMSRVSANVIKFDSALRPDTAGGRTLGVAAVGWNGLYLDYTNTATVGAVTINKPSGRAIIALGASSVVITNNLATAAAGCFAVLRVNDGTALSIRSCVTTSTNLTITTNGVAAADAAVQWFLINAD